MKQSFDLTLILRNKKYLAVGILLMILTAGSFIGDRTATQIAPKETSGVSDTFWQIEDTDGIDIASFESSRQSPQEVLTVDNREEPWWSFLIGITIKLALVVVLIYLTVLALKQFFIKPKSVIKAGKEMEVLESRTIGPATSLHLVRVGNKLLLLGAGSGDVRVLTEFDQDAPQNQDGSISEAGKGFGEESRDPFTTHLEAVKDRLNTKDRQNTPTKSARENREIMVINDLPESDDEIEETLQNCRTYLHKKVLELRRLSETWEDGSEAMRLASIRKSVAAASNRRG